MPRKERPTPTGNGFRSLAVSLVLHLLLAWVLWLVVITITIPQAIFLTGSTTPVDQAVSMNTENDETISIPIDPGDLPAFSDEVGAAFDALIASALQEERSSVTKRAGDAAPSIEFFGIKALGNQFVFILDISLSMNARGGERFRRARDELLRAVSGLEPGQRYYVFLFCWTYEEMYFNQEVRYVEVDAGHVERLRKWLDRISLCGGTDPRRALALARRMNPDVVFLLSDGEFNEPATPLSTTGWLNDRDQPIEMTVQEGVEVYYQNLPIHTIAFENPFTHAGMQGLSKTTGGSFKYVRTGSLQPVDSERFAQTLRQLHRKHAGQSDPTRQYQDRLFLAREWMSDGELLYAEYLLRPLRQADPEEILNPALLDELLDILESEVGETRLEDFQQPAEMLPVLVDQLSNEF